MNKTQFLPTTPDAKRKQADNLHSTPKKYFRTNSAPSHSLFSSNRFCQSNTNTDRPVKKCSFNIESLLELKTNENQISNSLKSPKIKPKKPRK